MSLIGANYHIHADRNNCNEMIHTEYTILDVPIND